MKMENPPDSIPDERSVDVSKPVEASECKVEKEKEKEADIPAPTAKPSGKKQSQEKDSVKSKEQQSVRERNRRGERSRGGEKAGRKGSVYRPRSCPECRIHISNIPFEYRWQDLKDLFRNEVGEVAFVELFEDDRGKPKGSGIVEFEKVEHARIALEKMNRYELKGRRLVVKEDSESDRDGRGPLIRNSMNGRPGNRNEVPHTSTSGRDRRRESVGHDGMRFDSGGNIGTLAAPSSTRWSNTYGLSPQFLDSLGISGPIFSRIFVANLDYKVEDAKLLEVFRLAGKVVFAEVVKDRDNRSRGFGVVEMSHPVEAVQAISMFNDQMLFDRRMMVRMDRDAERLENRSGSSRLPEGLRSIGMGLGTGGNPIHDVHPYGHAKMSMEPERNSNVYNNSFATNFHGGSHNGIGTGPTNTASAILGNSVPFSSSLVMGSTMDRSLSGFQSTIGSNQSHNSAPMNDYRRDNSESNYRMSDMGNRGSLNDMSNNSTSTSYGYLTESLSARGSSLTSVPDYERREPYPGYRSNQVSRERQDFPTNSSEYDSVNRMATFGSSIPSFSVPTSASSRSSDTIVVTNLPLNFTWQDLRDKFCEVGDVLFADIRGKGMGVVRFSSERDAQRACAMLNRTRMEGNTIEVEFY